MFEALLPVDDATGKSRGYMVLGYDGSEGSSNAGNDGGNAGGSGGNAGGNGDLAQLPLSVIFGSKKSKDYVRREYKQYLQRFLSTSSGDDDDNDNVPIVITLASVIEFWTEDYTDTKRVWELVEPQLQPVDAEAIRMLESVRRLIQRLIRIDDGASSIPSEVLSTESGDAAAAVGGQCCNSHSQNNERKLEISPAEVLYVVYLASLPSDVRRRIVYEKRDAARTAEEDETGSMIEADDATREQLLAEAALISYAIETCDFDL
mmetsp:Transcript_34587/g.63608  ORF Transcript_34587/g.63608 Transcript_34587/m.63608 type:complete len:262 (+) Transcript_34587:571-1356(+)